MYTFNNYLTTICCSFSGRLAEIAALLSTLLFMLLFLQDRGRNVAAGADHGRPAISPVNYHRKDFSSPVTVVIQRPDSEEQRYIDEDEAAGYSRIEDIKPGKGQEDVDMKEIIENGMTDEEFLNRYSSLHVCMANTILV